MVFRPPEKVPPFVPQNKVFRVLKESAKWGDLLGISTVGDLNDCISQGGLHPLIMTQEALQEEVAQIGAMMDTWKSRDVESFDQIYDKDAILNSDDELNSKLFTDRDPGMIAYADEYLKREGSHTGLLVVGAGHMVGDTGIVQGLKDLGYTVEVVPNP